jgi:hypothetical protein
MNSSELAGLVEATQVLGFMMNNDRMGGIEILAAEVTDEGVIRGTAKWMMV